MASEIYQILLFVISVKVTQVSFNQFVVYVIEKLLKAISEASEKYNNGKSDLQSAIREYDQAVADLTVSLISGLST